MFTQVAKSDRIAALIAKATGQENPNVDELAVFEAVAANTNPLRRKTGLFAGARIQEDVLLAMKARLDAGNFIPLALMHRSGVPVGRVIAGEMRGQNLHVLFYLPRTESEFVRKINAGVISEVSVGIEAQRILCSACGWDYLSDEATIDHIFEGTCKHGHKIGVDGVHTRLSGLADWMELSLVDRGAVPGASILPPARQTFSVDEKRGFDPKSLRLFASADPGDEPKDPPKMTITIDEHVKVKTELALAQKEVETLKAALAEAQTKLTAATTEVDTLKASLAEAKSADIAALKASLADAEKFVEEIGGAALMGLGKKADELTGDFPTKIKLAREARAQFAAAIPVGGRSADARGDADKSTTDPKRALAAFGVK